MTLLNAEGRFELSGGKSLTSSPGSPDRRDIVSKDDLGEYVSLREIEDICDYWLKAIK